MANVRYYPAQSNTFYEPYDGVGGTVYQLRTTSGIYALVTGSINSEVFEEVLGFTRTLQEDAVIGATIPMSTYIDSVVGDVAVRMRFERRNSSNTILDATTWSPEMYTAGLYSATLTWTEQQWIGAQTTGDRLYVAVHLRRVSGHGGVDVTLRVNTESTWIDVPYPVTYAVTGQAGIASSAKASMPTVGEWSEWAEAETSAAVGNITDFVNVGVQASISATDTLNIGGAATQYQENPQINVQSTVACLRPVIVTTYDSQRVVFLNHTGGHLKGSRIWAHNNKIFLVIAGGTPDVNGDLIDDGGIQVWKYDHDAVRFSSVATIARGTGWFANTSVSGIPDRIGDEIVSFGRDGKIWIAYTKWSTTRSIYCARFDTETETWDFVDEVAVSRSSTYGDPIGDYDEVGFRPDMDLYVRHNGDVFLTEDGLLEQIAGIGDSPAGRDAGTHQARRSRLHRRDANGGWSAFRDLWSYADGLTTVSTDPDNQGANDYSYWDRINHLGENQIVEGPNDSMLVIHRGMAADSSRHRTITLVRSDNSVSRSQGDNTSFFDTGPNGRLIAYHPVDANSGALSTVDAPGGPGAQSTQFDHKTVGTASQGYWNPGAFYPDWYLEIGQPESAQPHPDYSPYVGHMADGLWGVQNGISVYYSSISIASRGWTGDTALPDHDQGMATVAGYPQFQALRPPNFWASSRSRKTSPGATSPRQGPGHWTVIVEDMSAQASVLSPTYNVDGYDRWVVTVTPSAIAIARDNQDGTTNLITETMFDTGLFFRNKAGLLHSVRAAYFERLGGKYIGIVWMQTDAAQLNRQASQVYYYEHELLAPPELGSVEITASIVATDVGSFQDTVAVNITSSTSSSDSVRQEDAVTINIVSSVSSSDSIVQSGIASLDASALLDSLGQAGKSGSATLTSGALLESSGIVGQSGTVFLYASSLVDLLGRAGQSGVSPLIGFSDLVATNEQNTAILSTNASISSIGTVGTNGVLQVSASALLTAAGQVGTFGSSTMVGSSDLSVVGQVGAFGLASISAEAQVVTIDIRNMSNLTAIATLTAVGEVLVSDNATAGLIATAVLGANGRTNITASADLNVAVNLSGYGRSGISEVLSLNALATLSAITGGGSTGPGYQQASLIVTRGLGRPANNLVTSGYGYRLGERLSEDDLAMLMGIAMLNAVARTGSPSAVNLFGAANLLSDGRTVRPSHSILNAFASLSGVGITGSNAQSNLLSQALFEADGKTSSTATAQLMAIANMAASGRIGAHAFVSFDAEAQLLVETIANISNLKAFANITAQGEITEIVASAAQLIATAALDALGRAGIHSNIGLSGQSTLSSTGRTSTAAEVLLRAYAEISAAYGISGQTDFAAFASMDAFARSGLSAAADLGALASLRPEGIAGAAGISQINAFASLSALTQPSVAMQLNAIAAIEAIGRSSGKGVANLLSRAYLNILIKDIVEGIANLVGTADFLPTARTSTSASSELLTRAYINSIGRTGLSGDVDMLMAATFTSFGRTSPTAESRLLSQAGIVATNYRESANLIGIAELILGSIGLPSNPAALLATARLLIQFRNIVPIIDIQNITATAEILRIDKPHSEVEYQRKNTTTELYRRNPSTKVYDPE